jgi:hypothetical protein
MSGPSTASCSGESLPSISRRCQTPWYERETLGATPAPAEGLAKWLIPAIANEDATYYDHAHNSPLLWLRSEK